MKLKYLISACFLLLFAAGNVAAQRLERQVAGSTGAGIEHPVTKYWLEYTVGEAMITPLVYSSTLVTQGFQQPQVGERVNGLADDLVLYPNPTTDNASIKFTLDVKTKQVDFRIMNLQGQEVFRDKILAPEFEPVDPPVTFWNLKYTFNVEKLLPGAYVMSIKTDGGLSVTKVFIKMRK